MPGDKPMHAQGELYTERLHLGFEPGFEMRALTTMPPCSRAFETFPVHSFSEVTVPVNCFFNLAKSSLSSLHSLSWYYPTLMTSRHFTDIVIKKCWIRIV